LQVQLQVAGEINTPKYADISRLKWALQFAMLHSTLYGDLEYLLWGISVQEYSRIWRMGQA
jgi:hypothetical protein